MEILLRNGHWHLVVGTYTEIIPLSVHPYNETNV